MSNPEFIALRVGLAGHPLVSEARLLCGHDRALVLAVLVEVIESGLSANDLGDLQQFNAEETAERYGVQVADVLAVLDALRVVGIISARLGQGYKDLHRHPIRYAEGPTE